MGKEKRKGDVEAALKSRIEPTPPEELEQIFRDHHGRIIQAAYRVTGSLTDAEDVLQTVFLRLLKRESPPNSSDQLGSYLHRAAVNAGIDLLRSRQSRRRVALEDVQIRLEEDRMARPDDRQMGRELRQWLRHAIAQLSPQAAEIFALRYLEGYRNQEIAEMVGTSPGVVAVVLHRARNRLRGQVAKFLGERLK